MDNFKEVAHKTVAELFDMLKEKQAEIEQIKAEIEGLKNPNLAQHTKKYREQCELFKSMSEVEKKAYSAGYDWACKVSQRQILTLIKDQEGVEDKLDDEIDSLKAQLECCRKENAVLLGKVGELEKNEFLLARVKTILGCEKKTNLLESIIVRDLRKVLRGEHEGN